MTATRAILAMPALLLFLTAALAPVAARAAAPECAVNSKAMNAMEKHDDDATARVDDCENYRPVQKLIGSQAVDAAAMLERKSADFRGLREEFHSKLQSIQRVRDLVEDELNGLPQHLGRDRSSASSAPSFDKMYDDMDFISLKVADLVRRTETVMEKVGRYNALLLKQGGQLTSGVSEDGEVIHNLNPTILEGLEKRLGNVLMQEIGRRDRYNASISEVLETENNATESNVTITEEKATVPENDTSSSPTSPYITLSELNTLLSSRNVIDPSESTLQKSLSALASQYMRHLISSDDEMWKSRLTNTSHRYEKEFNVIQQDIEKSRMNNQCLAIPRAVEIIGKALEEHYHDGTNLMDHANYENGGSVVHELTSASYMPPPRVDAKVDEGKSAGYEYEKQRIFDKQTQNIYHQQRAMLQRSAGGTRLLTESLSEIMDEVNKWEWYTSFKFEKLRQYLPEDWERVLDSLSDRFGKEGMPWSEYTPRGAIDALVPDYVYHSLGISNDSSFGKAFGQTASPEVAISTGFGKTGGAADARGWMAKPMGHCYPLSMRLDDDPALSILSRHTQIEGGIKVTDEDASMSLLVGPKYTVRLPYPVYVNGVTLEHRSFPIPQHSLEEGLMGGESAPRLVRVVGFPPCPTKDDRLGEGAQGVIECTSSGFDIANPIDLGSFEYKRITVLGREDDYGGSDGDEEDGDDKTSPLRRRRSIQTFSVKGGKLKPPLLLDNFGPEGSPTTSSQGVMEHEKDPTQCSLDGMSCESPPEGEAFSILELESEPEESLPPGQCAPPKDGDSLPSCTDDNVSASSSPPSSEGSTSFVERQAIKAVSFIIEKNWGSSEFTCLYRVRVHGDAISE